jgi:4'-phosphopantetheinyl transferase
MNSMIKCYYQYITEPIDSILLEQLIHSFPPSLAERISSYQLIKDRALRANGKILLLQLLQDFQLDKKYTLNDLTITEGAKPSFNTDFHFSTSHSGDVTICAAGHSRIGIDIELITDIDINDYTFLLSEKEWKTINEANNKNIGFYTIWTKKEALLKAIGKGWDYDMYIDVSGEQVLYESITYYFQTIKIADEYICHVVSEKNEEVIVTERNNIQ